MVGNATALLPQIMNRLAQKYIHSGFTFVIKQPLNFDIRMIFITFVIALLCTYELRENLPDPASAPYISRHQRISVCPDPAGRPILPLSHRP